MTQQATGSMEDLLASFIQSQKTAADANPPTSGPGGGPAPNQSVATEGARSAENDAAIREQLGNTGAEGAPPASTHTGKEELKHPAMAATVALTGEDPANENSRVGEPTEAERGTSRGELKVSSLSEKYAAWQEESTELLIELMSNKEAAAQLGGSQPAVDPPAAAGDKQVGEGVQPAGDKQAADETDIYTALANDAEQADLARDVVHAQLIESHQYGKKLAHVTINYLRQLDAEAAAQQNQTKQARLQQLTEKLASLGKRAADGGPSPEDNAAPSESDGAADSSGGSDEKPKSDPPATSEPPAAAGGEGELDLSNVTEEDLMAAIEQLASQEGVSPEVLIEELLSEAGGELGGGMPEDPQLVEDSLSELSGEIGIPVEDLAAAGDAVGLPPVDDPAAKLAAVRYAQKKLGFKKRALEVTEEKLLRAMQR